MKIIELSKNKHTLVDDADYDFLSQWKWSCDSRGYAVRTQKVNEIKDGIRKTIFLHRELLKAADGVLVDHINSDPLDNRRQNIRLCSPSENMRNRKVAKSNKSGLKGVWFNPKVDRWVAYIKLDGKSKTLAKCSTKEEAAYIYDQISMQLWGRFAQPNFNYDH